MIEKSFKQLGLKVEIIKALDEMGFISPTEIQQKSIPILLQSEHDFIGRAQTGTGKTAAFVIPILEKMAIGTKDVQAIILSPTRELALQIEREIQKIGKYLMVKSLCVYGGTPYDKQVKALKRDHPQIIVGTPGRVLDLIKRNILKLQATKMCVLDEADEMLNMGFLEDVQLILDRLHDQRQMMMFSATMPKPILKMIERSFNEYKLVHIKKSTVSNIDIEQKYFVIREKHFKEALARLIASAINPYAIIFCRTKIETKEVGDDLKRRGYKVEVLNGDMGQNEREHAMQRFKEHRVNLLVCTDVAARGIDVINLTHVFNYGLPQDSESYVHRIGRTGRAGMKGKAYTIVGPRTAGTIKKIEEFTKSKIEFAKLPTVDVLKRSLIESELDQIDNLAQVIKEKGDTFFLDSTYELFYQQVKNLTKDQLIKLMFTLKFNHLLKHYNSLGDIEIEPGKRDSAADKRRERNKRRSSRRKQGRSFNRKKRRRS